MGGKAEALRVNAADIGKLQAGDFLIIGSPIYGGRPTPAIQAFVDKIPKAIAEKLAVAAFDTRLSMKFAKIFGRAADRIAAKLKEKGCTLKAPPEGFIVLGREGPLAAGEIERAADWARKMRE